MEFKKFSSLKDTHRANLIEKVQYEGKDGGEWVVTEKIHGANFSFWCDGNEVKVASRLQFVDGTFYNCQAVIDRYSDKILSFCKENGRQIVIYGELYGNGVQKKVNYGERDFVAFDVHCLWSGSPEHKEYAMNICEQIGIPFVPIIFKGSLHDCLKINNTFKSLLTPDGYEGENISEGLVIEPVDPAWFNNGSRIYFRNKTEKFSEKKRQPKEKVVFELSETESDLMNQLLCYNTPRRVSNVISKIGVVTSKDFGRILGMTVKDILEDFEKDTSVNPKNVAEDNWQQFSKILSASVGDVVRKEFLLVLE